MNDQLCFGVDSVQLSTSLGIVDYGVTYSLFNMVTKSKHALIDVINTAKITPAAAITYAVTIMHAAIIINAAATPHAAIIMDVMYSNNAICSNNHTCSNNH